jgi:hypothetical protein
MVDDYVAAMTGLAIFEMFCHVDMLKFFGIGRCRKFGRIV